MTRSEMHSRIAQIRNELENRFKYGKSTISSSEKDLQTEMYSLIYKLSKFG